MEEESTHTESAGGAVKTATPIQIYYRQLHEKCGTIIETSLEAFNAQKISRSQQFVQEVELWCDVLLARKEADLLRMAAHEYQYALLALSQGHYRHAFKGLRLVLELTLQSTHLSAHELELREWFEHRKDTIWAVLVDAENGVFSVRFARAFFPTLEAHVAYHRSLTQQIYRECSECVHGSIPKHVPLPQNLAYSQESFDLWHAKADIVALVAHLSLCLRHLISLSLMQRAKLEPVLTDRLGHIQEIRVALGGPQGG